VGSKGGGGDITKNSPAMRDERGGLPTGKKAENYYTGTCNETQGREKGKQRGGIGRQEKSVKEFVKRNVIYLRQFAECPLTKRHSTTLRGRFTGHLTFTNDAS